MGLNHSPSIVTTGLVLALDATNPRSYDSKHNLALYSQDWTQQFQAIANVTIATANTVAPDGTLTGQRITTTVSGIVNDGFIQKLYSYSGKTIPTANNLFTFSSYVKQGTSPKTTVLLGPYNGTSYKDFYVILNWSDLSITTGGNIAGRNYYGVTPDANGWYRLWCTTDNYYGATDFGYRIFTRDNGSNNVAGEYSYIWGSQVEYSNVPGPYIVTTSTPVLPSNTWIDLSTTRNNGTTANTPTYEIANGAFYFSGYRQANSYVNFASVASNLPTMSVEVWANLINNGPNGFAYILGQSNSVWRLMYSASSFGWVCATTNNSWYSSNTTVSTSGTSTNNRWNHVVVVYDGTNHKIYVNGVLSATSTGIASGNIVSPGTANGLNIMLSDAVNVDNGAGRLAMAKIYSIALTPEQILQNFNAHRARYGL